MHDNSVRCTLCTSVRLTFCVAATLCVAISCSGNTNNGNIPGGPSTVESRNNTADALNNDTLNDDINSTNATDGDGVNTDGVNTSSPSKANERIASFLGGLNPNDIDMHEIEQAIFNSRVQHLIAVCMQQAGLEYIPMTTIPPPVDC